MTRKVVVTKVFNTAVKFLDLFAYVGVERFGNEDIILYS